MKKETGAINQHKKMAMGEKVSGFKKGGTVKKAPSKPTKKK